MMISVDNNFIVYWTTLHQLLDSNTKCFFFVFFTRVRNATCLSNSLSNSLYVVTLFTATLKETVNTIAMIKSEVCQDDKNDSLCVNVLSIMFYYRTIVESLKKSLKYSKLIMNRIQFPPTLKNLFPTLFFKKE